MRFLFQYKPAGTRSFRLSSSKLFNFGGNSQNNDKESMDIFEAPPGWCFVQRDQAGAEALYVAYDAKPGRYRALFENGVKAHTYVALHLFIDKFRGQHPRDRYWCKTAPELKELEEWAQISKAIAKSKFEYDIGKKTGHACVVPTTLVTPKNSSDCPVSEKPPVIQCYDLKTHNTPYLPVTWNEYDYNGLVYGDYWGNWYTPEHRIPYYDTNGELQVDTIAKLHQQYNEIGWIYGSGVINFKQTILTKHYKGKVYCPTTETGYFLISSGPGKKRLVTGNSNYKMGPVTFRDSVLKESEGTMVLTMEQARFYLETYKELFPEIVVWQIEIEDTIRRTRLLRNAFGYPRRFERIITDSYIREGISWKPQSTIGVITHRAFVETRNHIVKYGLRWRPISNKHDSYALMIPEPDVEQAREVMMRDINQTITCAHGSFTMKSDFQVGYNLRKYHELHNPRGMREL